jgi:hypothetical protein
MERVETLCNLLAEKIRSNAPVHELLDTVRMLESELIHLKNNGPQQTGQPAGATVKIFKQHESTAPASQPQGPPPTEERTVEVLQVDEAEIEAELEEIKKNLEERNKISVQNKPQIVFDPIDDIPTFAGRVRSPEPAPVAKAKEIHELLPVNKTPSVNEILKKMQGELELADTLRDSPVKDLKKAIGVNERYGFINELFRGDEAMYERSIKTINSFAIFAEAEYWIRRELKLKLGWDDKNETVRKFDQLIRRRFS